MQNLSMNYSSVIQMGWINLKWQLEVAYLEAL